jgi:hypothetical protein
MSMIVEVTFLVLGLLVLFFHKQVGDFVLEQERRLAARLTQHGIFVPEFPSREFAHDLYFVIGVVVALATSIQIYVSL